MPAEATQKSRIKAKVKEEVEKTMPDATPEEKEAYTMSRFTEKWEKYTPGRRGRHASSSDQPTPMETGRTRSRLEIRMGYEQKPCFTVSMNYHEGYDSESSIHRPVPTVEHPDYEEYTVQGLKKAMLNQPSYAFADREAVVPYDLWTRSEEALVPYLQPSSEMQLWQAYRNDYEEKGRKNEEKLQRRIASLEQQLMQLQDKYLPSTWSCVDPIVAKIEEQNKIIEELKKENAQLYKQLEKQNKIIHDLEKENAPLHKQLEDLKLQIEL